MPDNQHITSDHSPQLRSPASGVDGLTVLVCLVILGVYFGATVYRNRVWLSHISLWQDTVTKSPMKTRPRINLARSYQEAEMYDDAIREYSDAATIAKLPHIDPVQGQITRQLAAMNMSQIMLKFGAIDEAEKVLVSVWNEEPGFPGIAINLAIVYMNKGNPQFAKEVLDVGIESIPSYPWFQLQGRLYFNRGLVRQILGDCAGAEEDFAYARTERRDADLPQVSPICDPAVEQTF